MAIEDLDSEDRIIQMGGGLPSVRRRNWTDVAILSLIVVLGTFAVGGSMLHLPQPVVVVAGTMLMLISFAGAYMRIITRPDHVRALQSDRMLSIANESMVHLRKGLGVETAQAVCRIVLEKSEAAAVAITDNESVLGFAGVGEDHHLVGGPIMTKGTHEALETDTPQVLYSKDEIGCPDQECRLRAAIIVVLQMRGRPVGTLKFYYESDNYLSETELAMAEGLAQLLSTQLELSELEAQTELATAMELKALQAQINPHFLFNTINTIAAFIRIDPNEARHLLRQFGALYRRTLENATDLVTLEREVEFVNTYLELEQARFGEQLVLDIDISPEVRQIPMPAFMIQPIVENSVGHAMRPDGTTLHISIRARRVHDSVVVTVADDGVGIPADRVAHVLEPGVGTGLGLALRNVRDRLRGHYGPESTFEIDSLYGEGTTIRLTIRPVPKPTELHEPEA
jgi:two-component system sensor histidine kinase LytS